MIRLAARALLLLGFQSVYGHVGLKYPPARVYDLDFLDNSRTTGDCGMERGSLITVLEAGSQLNVTWSLGYAHRGGYKIELVNNGESQALVPADPAAEWESGAGTNTQHHMVTVPEVSDCLDNCYLRLQRQAAEWGKSYLFRSCADVAIKSKDEYKEDCSGHGQITAAPTATGSVGCQCDKFYTGSKCQYRTLCETDADCNQGECIELDDAIYSDRRCFCKPGWFGLQCEKKSDIDSTDFSRSSYQRVKLPNGAPAIYWRVQNGEVEMVVEAETSSYVAVGWRPEGAKSTCQEFPEDALKPRRASSLHGMDCTDMVIGMAKGGTGHLADYYTRDRSTPRMDAFWGGSDDLSSGIVKESGGKTIMIFRKPLAGGRADHDFGQKMHFIWATGQVKEFYGDDQLKYHGGMRGKATTEFDVSGSERSSTASKLLTSILSVFLVVLFK